MSRLPLRASLLRQRAFLLFTNPERRFTHSDPPRNRVVSGLECTVGIVVIFAALLSPAAYFLANLKAYRKG